jgi:hypothetical protein
MENRHGWMLKIVSCLDESGIEVLALSIAEAGEVGLMRLIVSDPDNASKVLEAADFSLARSRRNTEVTAALIADENRISKVTRILADSDVNIEYAYSFGTPVAGRFVLILRVDDTMRAEKALTENGITVLSLDDLRKQLQ